VIRTFTSPADARNAIVGFVEPSNRSSTCSASADSPIPAARRIFERTTVPPLIAASSGRIVPSIISTISSGTPGIA
jgi:hypothetical protein